MAPPPAPAAEAKPIAKPKREKRPAAKNDPKLVAAARELRDRYLERFNEQAAQLTAGAKYDVGRVRLAGPEDARRIPLLIEGCAV